MEAFNSYACIGDSIRWQSGPFEMQAVIEFDQDTKPTDYDCYDPDAVKTWESDDWFYCGIVVTASIEGVELGRASLWGIECNFPGGDNSYLAEVAKDVAPDAIQRARERLDSINEKAA